MAIINQSVVHNWTKIRQGSCVPPSALLVLRSLIDTLRQLEPKELVLVLWRDHYVMAYTESFSLFALFVCIILPFGGGG